MQLWRFQEICFLACGDYYVALLDFLVGDSCACLTGAPGEMTSLSDFAGPNEVLLVKCHKQRQLQRLILLLELLEL